MTWGNGHGEIHASQIWVEKVLSGSVVHCGSRSGSDLGFAFRPFFFLFSDSVEHFGCVPPYQWYRQCPSCGQETEGWFFRSGIISLGTSLKIRSLSNDLRSIEINFTEANLDNGYLRRKIQGYKSYYWIILLIWIRLLLRSCDFQIYWLINLIILKKIWLVALTATSIKLVYQIINRTAKKDPFLLVVCPL